MRILLLILTLSMLASAINGQDINGDGRIDRLDNSIKYDLNGLGTATVCPMRELLSKNKIKLQVPPGMNVQDISFSQFWVSPSGAFGNCWDGAAGYFDNDTLLDIAGYTFSPNMFYIWEQVATRPDSFALVFSYTKVEFGGFGPMAVGDIDGDGKVDIILSDFSTLSRIYIISNTANNTYVSRETQNTLTHPADGSSAQALIIGDLNKNGQKEIICMRGNSSPTGGMVRLWEHTGSPGSFTFNNLYTYTTVSYLFGKSGIGDSNGDGWDEVFLTYGGYDIFNMNVRKIHFDSASSTFQHEIFTAPAIGFPSFYKISDVNNDGINELIATGSSLSRAAIYIFKSNGVNQYQVLDSVFENNDPNTMMTSDIKLLTGDVYPSILAASFGGSTYVYRFDGTHYPRLYASPSALGPAIRRVYWLPWTGYDGFFNTWSSTSSNGTFYLYKKDPLIGIENNQLPGSFYIEQNYPNPFNPITKIKFSIPFTGQGDAINVRLTIYDISGRLVSELMNTMLQQGEYSVNWDASNYSSGVYFYRLDAGSMSEIKKMVMVK